MARGRDGEVYDIVDDEPVAINDWVVHAARALDAQPPFSIPLWQSYDSAHGRHRSGVALHRDKDNYETSRLFAKQSIDRRARGDRPCSSSHAQSGPRNAVTACF